jgi:AcrR family transcriptional regulator
VEGPQGTLVPTLADEQKQVTRARIRRAAMVVVARRGFGATVDEIARESGVSPRTIFRHYTTHQNLIVATVRDMFEACGRRPIEGLPSPDHDCDGWLEGLALTIHTRNAEILGEAFWDIHARDLLGEVAVPRREARLRGVRHITTVAWHAGGGTGAPPDDLESAFALHFSAFTTQALMIDFDRTPHQIGALTADILKTLLRRAVAAQRSSADSRDTRDRATASADDQVPISP